MGDIYSQNLLFYSVCLLMWSKKLVAITVLMRSCLHMSAASYPFKVLKKSLCSTTGYVSYIPFLVINAEHLG